MEAKREIKFIFNEEDFENGMNRMPKDQDELNKWADAVVECIQVMVNYDIVYENVFNNYKDNNDSF